MSAARMPLPRERAGLDGEWDALADRSGAAPFVRPGWIRAWARAFAPGATLDVLAVRRDGRLAAVLPVLRTRGTLRSPTNWHTPMFGPVAEDADAAQAVLQKALGSAARHVAVGFLDEDVAGRWAEAARRHGCRAIVRTLQRQPYVETASGDWDGFEASLGRKRRYELRRRLRRLEEQGIVQFSVTSGAQRLAALLDEGFAVEGSGWKAEQGTAIRSQAATRRFYADVAAWASERGWLRLCFLRLDGRALAFDLSLEVGGVHYLLKTGYDASMRAYGPGQLLRREMIARAFRDRLRSYEFLGENQEWKQEWTSDVRRRVLLQAFPRSPLGVVDWCVYAYGRPLARNARTAARALLSR